MGLFPDRPGQLPGETSTLFLADRNHRPKGNGGPSKNRRLASVCGNPSPEFLLLWIVKVTLFTTALLFF
jgi:hypothetical protein